MKFRKEIDSMGSINVSNDKMVNLIHGYNISIAAKLPHVPEANLM